MSSLIGTVVFLVDSADEVPALDDRHISSPTESDEQPMLDFTSNLSNNRGLDLIHDLTPDNLSTSADDLTNTGVSAEDLTNLGTSAEDLAKLGTSAEDLTNTGASADDLTNHGTSADDLNNHSTSADDLNNHGTSADDLTNHGTSADDLNNLSAAAENLTTENDNTAADAQDDANLTSSPADDSSPVDSLLTQQSMPPSKEQILADLDSESPGESGTAVSLFDLITGMSPPEHEQVSFEQQPAVSEPLNDGSTMDAERHSSSGQTDESLDTDVSTGLLEQQTLNEDQMFRPISGNSEYDSEAFSHDDQIETHCAEPLKPSLNAADCTFQPIESAVGTFCTPLEECFEPVICPQPSRAARADRPHEAFVGEMRSPLSSCGSQEQQNWNLDSLKDTLVSAPFNEDTDGNELSQVVEPLIVPKDRITRVDSKLVTEPALDDAHVDEHVNGYSDAEELNEPLEQAADMNPTRLENIHGTQLALLENSTVEEAPMQLSPDQRDDHHGNLAEKNENIPSVNMDVNMPKIDTPSSPEVNQATSSQMPPAGVTTPNIGTGNEEPIPSPVNNLQSSPELSDGFDGDESSEGEEMTPAAKPGGFRL